MDISVIMATYKRADLIKQTLESFISLNTRDIIWQLIISDNAGDAQTERIVRSYENRLPLQFLKSSKRGKNAALNSALSKAEGELFVFTDDDIIADPAWLKQLWEGIKRWPEHAVFGGRIEPSWPDGKIPFQGLEPAFINSSYVIANWGISEGPISSGKVWGPNMAIRRTVFDKGYRFNELIGPQGGNYIMGSETELTKRLERDGYGAVYLPKALVYHIIRKEQTKPSWIYGRAFRYGRSDVYEDIQEDVPMVKGVPRYLYRLMMINFLKFIFAALTFQRKKRIECGIDYWMVRGRIYEYRRKYKIERT